MGTQITAYQPLQVGQGEAFVYKNKEVDLQPAANAISQALLNKEAQKEAAKAKEISDRVNNRMKYDKKLVERYIEPSKKIALEVAQMDVDINSGKIDPTRENMDAYDNFVQQAEMSNAKLGRDAQIFTEHYADTEGLNDDYYDKEALVVGGNNIFNDSYEIANQGDYTFDLEGKLKSNRESRNHEHYKPFATTKDWLKDFEAEVKQDVSVRSVNEGTMKTTSRVEGKFLVLDDNGDVVPDKKTGKPMVNIDQLAQALPSWKEKEGNEEWLKWTMANLAEAEKDMPEDQRTTEVDVVRDLLSPNISAKETESATLTKSSKSPGDGEKTTGDLSLGAEAFVKIANTPIKYSLNEMSTPGTGAPNSYFKANNINDEGEQGTIIGATSDFVSNMVSAYEKTGVTLDLDKSYVEKNVFYPKGKSTKGGGIVKLEPVDFNVKNPIKTFENRIHNMTATAKNRKLVPKEDYEHQLPSKKTIDTSEVSKNFDATLDFSESTTKKDATKKWLRENNLPNAKVMFIDKYWNSPVTGIKFQDGDETKIYKIFTKEEGKKISPEEKRENELVKQRMFELSIQGGNPKKEDPKPKPNPIDPKLKDEMKADLAK